MNVREYPIVFFIICFIVMWLSARAGIYLRRRRNQIEDDRHADLAVILGASLTLMGLIIGFSFSMAIGRYDQRKDYEEAEANAIGTEYLRAGLLPSPAASTVRDLLRKYLDQRVLFYTTLQEGSISQIDASTNGLQRDLWSAVQTVAVAQPTPVNTLVAAGMNDVLNSQGYTRAAWRNRIPTTAWILLIAIGVWCNVLFGYNARRPQSNDMQFVLLPVIVAVSFFLIADMDTPRHGLIHVSPQNLVSVADSLRAP